MALRYAGARVLNLKSHVLNGSYTTLSRWDLRNTMVIIHDAPNNERIQKIAKFAVAERNKTLGSQLRLEKIEWARLYLRDMFYRITLQVMDGAKSKKCFIKVLEEKESLDSLQLTEWETSGEEPRGPRLFQADVLNGSYTALSRKDVRNSSVIIDDAPNNETIQKMAKFAVAERNKTRGSQLCLEKIVWAEQLFLPHLAYNITLEVMDGAKSKKCLIEVRPGKEPLDSLQLTDWEASGEERRYWFQAERAIEALNLTPFSSKPIRVMYTHREPSIRKSGAGNIFIKNLDKAIDNKALYETFSSFGNIMSCKIATDVSGLSKGYGFVKYDNKDSAQKAIEKLNGMLLNDKQVYVGPLLRRQERENTIGNAKFINVYVKNLGKSTTEDDLKRIFGVYGKTTSAVVMRDMDGKSKCFGFVNFENPGDAAKAVEALNGHKFDEKEWYVGKAQKKAEREAEPRHRFEQNLKETVDKYQGRNLDIKDLDDSVDHEKLKELFSQFGTITSWKVMRDPTGVSKGSGFVGFSSAEEASRALMEMNGKIIVSESCSVLNNVKRKKKGKASDIPGYEEEELKK